MRQPLQIDIRTLQLFAGTERPNTFRAKEECNRVSMKPEHLSQSNKLLRM